MTTDDLVQQARQQALGDLPRRTARRVPDKVAIVDGDTRLTFAELDAVVDRAAAALADAGPRQGRPAGAAVATTAGSSRCWTSRPPGPGSCWCRSTSCSAPTRSRSSSTTAAPTAFVVEDALVPVAGRALAASGGAVTARAVDPARGRRPVPDGWADAQEWFDHDGRAAAGRGRPTTTRCG